MKDKLLFSTCYYSSLLNLGIARQHLALSEEYKYQAIQHWQACIQALHLHSFDFYPSLSHTYSDPTSFDRHGQCGASCSRRQCCPSGPFRRSRRKSLLRRSRWHCSDYCHLLIPGRLVSADCLSTNGNRLLHYSTTWNQWSPNCSGMWHACPFQASSIIVSCPLCVPDATSLICFELLDSPDIYWLQWSIRPVSDILAIDIRADIVMCGACRLSWTSPTSAWCKSKERSVPQEGSKPTSSHPLRS